MPPPTPPAEFDVMRLSTIDGDAFTQAIPPPQYPALLPQMMFPVIVGDEFVAQ
jgi:hypothetical protein